MRQRIARHQADRAQRVPGMATVEEPLQLAQAIGQHSARHAGGGGLPETLWLTNCLMPLNAGVDKNFKPNKAFAQVERAQAAPLLIAIEQAKGPLVLVGNEIGLGMNPLGTQVRAFVDALGTLNQAVATACQRVTLMAAGLPLTFKETP